jgi:hypothetical protein
VAGPLAGALPEAVRMGGGQHRRDVRILPLPDEHHKHLKSTNMLERLNQEIKRRTLLVRIFPNEASCLRLARALAVEIHEQWIDEHRYLNMDCCASTSSEHAPRRLDAASAASRLLPPNSVKEGGRGCAPPPNPFQLSQTNEPDSQFAELDAHNTRRAGCRGLTSVLTNEVVGLDRQFPGAA